MKRFFIHDSGRLKAGRIAFFVFVSVLVGCTFVYYLGKPADKVLVAVKHVFEAEEAPAPQPEPKTEPESDATEKQDASPTSVQEAATAAREKASSNAAPGPDMPDKNQPDAADSDSNPAKDEPSTEPQDLKNKNHGESDQEEDSAEKDALAATPPHDIGTDEKAEREDRRDTPHFYPVADMPSKDHGQNAGPAGEATLSTQDYADVHKSWRESGALAAGEGGMPLRIKNLKAVYPLFQMKAVALGEGVPSVDLADGTRIAEGALASYSTTCFLASDPFGQWWDALKKAGFSPKSDVKVRYYMYDTIRNAIYARAAEALDCCRQKGLIPEAVDHDAVDVLGRAFAIKRQGGGRFGVFVPTRIDLPDGRSIPVDPSCFAGSPDIDHLMAAGKLR